MTRHLTFIITSRAVVEKLGGEGTVADMFGLTAKAVNNWSNWGWFPERLYARMMWELNKKGFTASPELWRQVGCDKLRIRRVGK